MSINGQIEDDRHVLLWQVHGQSDFTIDGESCRLRVGLAIWIPVGTQHSFTKHVNSVLLPMSFEVAATATTLRAPTVITVDRDLRTLFLAFIQSTCSIIRPSTDIARQILALIEERPVLVTALPMQTTASACSWRRPCGSIRATTVGSTNSRGPRTPPPARSSAHSSPRRV